MSDDFYESPIKSLRREKEEAQREGLRLVALLRERDDTLAAVREWGESFLGNPEVLTILDRNDTTDE